MRYSFKREPRPHQRKALIKALTKKRCGLFLRVGSGKTKIALDLMGGLFQRGDIQRCLIMAPLNALGVWEDEFELNVPSELELEITLFRPRQDFDLRKCKVLLVNYEYARRKIGVLMSWAPQMIIADESHRLKSPYSKQAKCAHKLGAISHYNIAMTGTSHSEKPLNLWSQFQFIDPSVLNCNYKDFKNEYGVWAGFGNFKLVKYKNLDKLAKLVGPHIITMRQDEYLKLPPETSINIPVEMGSKCQTMYKMMEREFLVQWKDKEILAPLVITQLMKLSQLANGFIIDQEQKPISVGYHKVLTLRDLTDDLSEDEVKRLVVFCRFKWDIDNVREALAERWEVKEISGRIGATERREVQHYFSSDYPGKIAVICQISSGSASINLQSANHVVFYSWDYSAINYDQAKGRIRRDGQKKPCFYHHLLSKGTIDFKILRILKQKKDVADMLEGLIREMSEESDDHR